MTSTLSTFTTLTTTARTLLSTSTPTFASSIRSIPKPLAPLVPLVPKSVSFTTYAPRRPIPSTSEPTLKTAFLTSFVSRLFSSPSGEMVSAARSKAQSLIDDNAVVVFSKSYCPYCRATKKTLGELGVQAVVLELDQIDDGSDIQAALAEISGQRTVPNIFINKKHIGGNSDLQEKKASGELKKLLEEAGALQKA